MKKLLAFLITFSSLAFGQLVIGSGGQVTLGVGTIAGLSDGNTVSGSLVSGVPPSASGQNGDYFLDQSLCIWGPKASNAWPGAYITCGGGGGGGATLPFPGPVCATSASGGTVCTSSQIQSAIGTGVYQAAGSYQAPISLTTTGTNCATSTFAANVLNIPACTPTSGGLTSFTTGNLSPLFTVSLGGSPTTSPALAFTLSNAAQNSVLAGPSTGGSGAPSYRALVSADIPSLAYLPSSTQLAQTLSSATHQWIKSYTASTGTFTQTQPASTDLSDYPIGGFAAATASTTVNGQTCTLGSSCTVTTSSAPTYYVSTSGSDSNNGTSIATPWATIAHVSSLQSSFTPGTKILFQKGGVWSEEFDITSLSGSNGSPIMIGGYGNGSYWTIDGGQTSGVNGRNYCIDAINTTFKWITVDGLECRNAYMQGVTFQAYTGTGTNGVGIVVKNSYIHHDGKSACTTCGTTPATDPGGYVNQLDAQVTTGVQFLNNTIDHCGGHNCLEVHYDAGNPIISGNIVGTLAPFCNHMCIDWKGGTNVLVQNNTVYCPTCALAAFYTENTNAAYVEINLPNETATVTGNVAYGMNVANATGFQVETGGAAASGSPTINAKFYNNTYYSANSSTYGFMDGSCTGHTLDIQKNIFDGGQVDIHTGCTTTYDYNVDGGVYPITFGYISPGPHDLTNVNPLYVTVAVGNFTPSANSILTGGVADTVNTNAWLGALNNTSFNSNLGGGTPGGSSGAIQVNNSGAFGAASAAQVVAASVGARPLIISSTFNGSIPANQVFKRLPASVAFSFATNCTGSQAVLGTSDTSGFTITMYKNGTSFGTIVFAASATTATFTCTATSFSLGDVLTVIGPSSAPVTGANFGGAVNAIY